jgi:hypothetical protein
MIFTKARTIMPTPTVIAIYRVLRRIFDLGGVKNDRGGDFPSQIYLMTAGGDFPMVSNLHEFHEIFQIPNSIHDKLDDRGDGGFRRGSSPLSPPLSTPLPGGGVIFPLKNF